MDGATSCPARLSSACTRTVPLSCPGLSDFNIVMTKVWDVYFMSPPFESLQTSGPPDSESICTGACYFFDLNKQQYHDGCRSLTDV
jgi:hypothetical protein